MDLYSSYYRGLWWSCRQYKHWIFSNSVFGVWRIFCAVRLFMADSAAARKELWLFNVFDWEAIWVRTLAVAAWKVKRTRQSKPWTTDKNAEKSWRCFPLWFQHDYRRVRYVQRLEYAVVNQNSKTVFQRIHSKIQTLFWRVRIRLHQRNSGEPVRTNIQSRWEYNWRWISRDPADVHNKRLVSDLRAHSELGANTHTAREGVLRWLLDIEKRALLVHSKSPNGIWNRTFMSVYWRKEKVGSRIIIQKQ